MNLNTELSVIKRQGLVLENMAGLLKDLDAFFEGHIDATCSHSGKVSPSTAMHWISRIAREQQRLAYAHQEGQRVIKIGDKS